MRGRKDHNAAVRTRPDLRAPAWVISDFAVGGPRAPEPHMVRYAATFSVVFPDHRRFEGWVLYTVPRLDYVTDRDGRQVAFGAFLEAPPLVRLDTHTLNDIRRSAFALWLDNDPDRARCAVDAP